MVEMTVRQNHRLYLFEVQAHPANVTIRSIGIRTGVKENQSLPWRLVGRSRPAKACGAPSKALRQSAPAFRQR